MFAAIGDFFAFLFAPWTELGQRKFLDGMAQRSISDLSDVVNKLRVQLEQTRQDIYPRLNKAVLVDGDWAASWDQRVDSIEAKLTSIESNIKDIERMRFNATQVPAVPAKRVAKRR